MSNPIEPRTQPAPPILPRGSLDEYQKRGLRCIIDVARVDKHAGSGGADQLGVSADKSLECHFIPATHEPAEQFAVGLLGVTVRVSQVADEPDDPTMPHH
jgi:hypothetical protein